MTSSPGLHFDMFFYFTGDSPPETGKPHKTNTFKTVGIYDEGLDFQIF